MSVLYISKGIFRLLGPPLPSGVLGGYLSESEKTWAKSAAVKLVIGLVPFRFLISKCG